VRRHSAGFRRRKLCALYATNIECFPVVFKISLNNQIFRPSQLFIITATCFGPLFGKSSGYCKKTKKKRDTCTQKCIRLQLLISLFVSSSSSSSSTYICHGLGPLVDPFRSPVSRSLFKGLP